MPRRKKVNVDHVGVEVIAEQVELGLCGGCHPGACPPGGLVDDALEGPGYRLRDAAGENWGALTVCRSCAVKMALAILELEVG